MDASSINKHSKSSPFNKFKYPLYKDYPRFSKVSRVGDHLNKFLVLLYDCVTSLNYFFEHLQAFKE